MERSFKEKAELGNAHFKSLFTDPGKWNIREIMRMSGLVPDLIDEDMNRSLEVYVTKEDVLNTLQYFKKRVKIPCPNGLSIELYLVF